MTKLCIWGNSLGLRIPRHLAEVAGLRAGNQLYLRLLDSGEILVRPSHLQAVGSAGTESAASDTTLEMTDEEVRARW